MRSTMHRMVESVSVATLLAACSSTGAGSGSSTGSGTSGGTAACGDVMNVTFPDPRCERCMRDQCCAEVQACGASPDCVQCTQDPTVKPAACNASPDFGDPNSVFATKFVQCQTDKCGSDCQGVGGGPKCPSTDPRYPKC